MEAQGRERVHAHFTSGLLSFHPVDLWDGNFFAAGLREAVQGVGGVW